MIPGFDDNGYLPSGIHPATLEEIRERFGQQTEVRRVQVESLGWLLDLARRVGVRRLVINGSFTTDEPEPNDVDCVLLIDDQYPQDATADAELLAGLPFLQIELVEQADFDWFIEVHFPTDRNDVPKGMVEVIL